MSTLTGTADEPQYLGAVTRTFIADSLTPIQAYLAVAVRGKSCLLESVEGTDRISRFSFVGTDYLESRTFDADADMLTGIRTLVGKYHLDTSAIPFPGGAVCVFTYDAARRFEKIGRQPPVDVPFSDALVVIPGTWLVFDHFTHRLTLIGFTRDARDEIRVAAKLDEYVAKLRAQKMTIPAEVRASEPARASLDRREYLERVGRAKAAIYEGDCYQLQLGIRFCAPFQGGTPFDFYRQIRALNPSPYMFFIEHGNEAVFGASPEFLVRLDGRTARIRPLAGTRARESDPLRDAAVAAELLANEKERAEHVMLVDLGRNDLAVVCEVDSVAVDELMRIERYSHVMHIVSNVVGTLAEGKDAFDLFAAAFPAGTVTGTPKIRAMQIIDELEPVARGLYAGSIAHVDFNGDMDSCIILRSVTTAEGRAYWQASAGIVADSDPLAEYEEVFAKTAIVRAVLGLER